MIFQTIGPRLRKEYSPLNTDLTLGLTNVDPDRVDIFRTSPNISFMKGGDRPFATLYISVAKQ